MGSWNDSGDPSCGVSSISSDGDGSWPPLVAKGGPFLCFRMRHSSATFRPISRGPGKIGETGDDTSLGWCGQHLPRGYPEPMV